MANEGRLVAGVLFAFFAVALLAALDLVTDLRQGTTAGHVTVEGGVVLVGLIGAVLMARRLLLLLRGARASQAEARALAAELQATRAEAARWRDEARDVLTGLGAAIDRRFERWALSPAEKRSRCCCSRG
jgi:hypothetical protein